MLGLLAAALGITTVSEFCAAVCIVAGAVKLVLDTVETGQRVKKNIEKREKADGV
jgi:hypothetical protein